MSIQRLRHRWFEIQTSKWYLQVCIDAYVTQHICDIYHIPNIYVIYIRDEKHESHRIPVDHTSKGMFYSVHFTTTCYIRSQERCLGEGARPGQVDARSRHVGALNISDILIKNVDSVRWTAWMIDCSWRQAGHSTNTWIIHSTLNLPDSRLESVCRALHLAAL